MIGTTNSFLPQNSALKPNMVIDIDERKVSFPDTKLKDIVSHHSEFEYQTLKLVKMSIIILM